MLKNMKKFSLSICLISALAVAPAMLQASSASGFIEGSSESTLALREHPSFERQLVRINTGINLIRINTDIIENMPISQDSSWADKVVSPVNYRLVNNLDEVKNDEYYSTVILTDRMLGRRSLKMSPLEARLYWQASVIYQNKTNDNPNYVIPNMNVFPDISDSKSYTTFKQDSKVAIIKVEASSGNLYKNVEEAVLSLLPEDLQESAASSKDEYIDARDELGKATSEFKSIEVWLADDANAQSPERAEKLEEFEVATAVKNEKEKIFSDKEEIYFEVLAGATEAIESNFDASKIPLAKKLKNLLDAVDNNAFGAVSMFTSATIGLVRGVPMVDKELEVMHRAQALVSLVGIKKQFLGERIKRMATGTLLAVPNIFIGSYYAKSQTSKISKYQDIVETVLSGAEVAKS